MNRVIKFRVWSTASETMKTGLLLGSNMRINSDSIIMQFTGIADVNGQEIYEGDCDAVGNVVEFVNGSWCLNGDRPLTSRFIKAGNRFENPEFL